ncbi:MAG: copper homeostasis membrane protein CopD [Betaproteobacteria bacterium]
MTDWATIGVRFALYADVMLLFGVPLFWLYAPDGRDSIGARRGLLSALALTGIGLSLLSIAIMTAAMAGVALAEVDPDAIRMMVTDTPMGHAWVVRLAALAAFLGLILLRPRAIVGIAVLGGIALASLAWTGHGAAGEGSAGTIQLVADVAHLLAAAAWIGALIGLGAMVFAGDDPQKAHRALDSFSRAGSLIVGLVIASGLVNSLYLVGVQHLVDLPATPYGRLLIVKLLLFAGMLGLAALNRFRLTPALAADEPPSFGVLRLSLTLEAGAATAILALVAWLGTLEPPMSM